MKWLHLGILYLSMIGHVGFGGDGAEMAWRVAWYGAAVLLLQLLWKILQSCRMAKWLGDGAVPTSSTQREQQHKHNK